MQKDSRCSAADGKSKQIGNPRPLFAALSQPECGKPAAYRQPLEIRMRRGSASTQIFIVSVNGEASLPALCCAPSRVADRMLPLDLEQRNGLRAILYADRFARGQLVA